MTRARLLLAAALWALLGLPAYADCQNESFEGVDFSVCTFHPARDDIRLFHRDDTGRPYGQFTALRRALAARGLRLVAAMNGAMYHADLSAVGYYVEDGMPLAPLVTRDGPGNFGLLPNGVFCLAQGRARVVETLTFAAALQDCAYAMQSGPLLVQDGALHPRFIADSDSRFIRNGVGVRADGAVVWVITSDAVNFHRFARLMRDGLGAPDALYVDGKVSRLYAPELGRSDFGFPVGPIMAVVAPLE